MKTPDTTAKERAPRKPQMNVSAKAEEIALAERVAARRGLSVSALVRLLVLDEARRLGME